MNRTFGIITDLHFGPRAKFGGKLRKMSDQAGELTQHFVRCMNEDVRPDFIVNLGDAIEDESPEADRLRYAECQSLLRTVNAPLINVAGNHDTINLSADDLNRFWQRSGPLYYSFDVGDWHFVVLHTVEQKNVHITLPDAQCEWLHEDLKASGKPTIVLMHHGVSEQDLDDAHWFRAHPHLALVRNRQQVRRIFEDSGDVRAVFNGHLHRNHFDQIGKISYITVQSLIENLDDDAPGRPSAAHAVVRLSRDRMVVRVHGNDPARYQVEFTIASSR